MDPVDLAFAGVARQAELIRSGQISSRELVELYLGRIERLNPQINAFNAVFSEQALAEAEAADKRREGATGAPLLGVPIAVKDNVDIAGQVTNFGTGAFEEPATEDAAIVRRLRDAGAVIIGKTNLPELAIFGFTESKTWGITRNPWNPGRTPGGSSGGSAAAVAAGMVGAAHASDGAGSIRIPAANCNLFGLKPQRDRVTLAPETEHWHGMSVYGFLTRSVLDTALLLDVAMAGAQMATAPPPPERPFAGAAGSPPGKLRIGIATNPVRALAPPLVTDEIRGAVSSTAELLREQGHEVEEVKIPYKSVGNRITPRYLGGIRDEVNTVPDRRALESRTRGFKRLGSLLITKRALEKAKTEGEQADRERIGKLFGRFDVLITSPVGEPPVEIGKWEGKGAFRTLMGMSRSYPFCPVWNHTGQPACSVPAGFTADGLPLAVMMISRPNDEATLLSLAAQIESVRPWADRCPDIVAG
ncbi:MAG: amidase [Solirubrobacterales bacterium]